MSNLISVTVKSIGDQEIADKTHLINNKFIVTATESGGDTSIQYGLPKGLRTIVVDETGLDTTFQAATVEKIALSAVGVNGRSTPAETTKFLTSDIVLAVANPEDSSNSDITLVSGDVYTVDATLSSIVSSNDASVLPSVEYLFDKDSTGILPPIGFLVMGIMVEVTEEWTADGTPLNFDLGSPTGSGVLINNMNLLTQDKVVTSPPVAQYVPQGVGTIMDITFQGSNPLSGAGKITLYGVYT